ncbi:MAG: CHAD domain-containing protein [Ignavibacteria bacterium]|jgi:CHAD domain-containing protein
MGNSKKWEIPGIAKRQSVYNAARLILKFRIRQLLERIDSYFQNRTEENLHDIRIALRRVRYNMELFIVCFERKIFLKFYKNVESLQDLSGLVRDLDVFKQNIDSLIKEERVRVNKSVLDKVEERRISLEKDLELELMKFVHGKPLKDFNKLLN